MWKTDTLWNPPASAVPRHGRLSIKCNTFFPENFKWRFPVETFPRTVIQKRLNRGNVGFRNRSEVEALRVKEANHIVSILVCSPLPRFMGLGKVDKSMQKPCPADFRKRGMEACGQLCGQAGRSQNRQEKVPFIRADWSGMLRRLPALLPVFPGLPGEPFWGRPR